MNADLRRRVMLIALCLMSFGFFMVCSAQSEQNAKIQKYKTSNEFYADVDAGKIKSAEFQQSHVSTWTVTGELSDGRKFTATLTGKNVDELDVKLREANVDVVVKGIPKPGFLAQYGFLILMVLLLVFMVRNMKKMTPSGIAKGIRGGPKLALVPDMTFQNVAGLDEVIEEVKEIRDYLNDPGKFLVMGAKAPKGVLLLGPPGCGKTLLARAIAGEAKVPFFSMSGSEFVEMFVGVGAARVRGLFDEARNTLARGAKGAIIFIDEIDAVGRVRGSGLGGGHDEREQTLNQLLVEMDGFAKTPNIIIVAATNRPDILDPALLRPGRFDRHVTVDVPDLAGRTAILKIHAVGKPINPELEFGTIAKRTPGFTGADLENLLNEAATIAVRANSPVIVLEHIEEAIDRVLAGPAKKGRLISPDEKRIIAYHEAGHALVGYCMPKADTVHRVSIVSRGRALGLTWSVPKEENVLMSREQILDRMAMTMGGRVAEEFITDGDPTTGASNDIEKATQMARLMVTQWGLSKLGPIQYGQAEGSVYLGLSLGSRANYSEQMAQKIDEEVERLVNEALRRATETVAANHPALRVLVAALLEKETLEQDEINEIFVHNIVDP